MDDYAILTWRPGDPSSEAPLAAARRALAAMTWSLVGAQPGLEAWVPASGAPAVFLSPARDGVIVGRRVGEADPPWRPDPVECARRLCRAAWGRYVAVFREPGAAATAMFRDPSGGVEALSWTSGGLALVASDLAGLLEAAPPDRLAIDWERIGAALVDPIALAGACPLTGVTAVTPGALRSLDGGSEVPIWRPADFARRSLADTAETRRVLVAAVDAAVAHLARPGGRAIAEVSGGLDSSIVASALVRAQGLQVAEWVHYFVDDAGADERRYARATARHLGLRLSEVAKATFGLKLDGRASAADAIRPSVAGADAHYDQDLADRCRRLGATQIFSGLGGDTVFMQGGSPLLAADDYWNRPWRVGLGPALEVARHARRSVWSVWRAAQVSRFRPQPRPYRSETGHLVGGALTADRRDPHPWLADCRGVAPAKRRQLMHLAHQLLVTGRTARGQEAQIVNPLLSQPVMEVCLSLSTRALTHGGDDRAMARQAFGDRLAPEVFARRSKGDLGRHYGRAIAEDLEAVRGLLLEGALVGAGLVDPERLDALLTPETLIWKGPYREVLDMVMLEQWARSWSRRLARLGRAPVSERLVQPA